MPADHTTVTVPADSELGRRLKAARASGEPVVVDTGEDRYTLFVAVTEVSRDIFDGYDPQAAIAGLRALQGAFAGVDAEALLRDLRAQRAQDSRGRPA
jgi:hypothetical protein